MTYIVNDKCINCRFTDCVEVCPVDCFYIGENSIVINPLGDKNSSGQDRPPIVGKIKIKRIK